MSTPPSAAAASPTQFFSAAMSGDINRAAVRLDALLLKRGDGFGDWPGAARAQRDVAALVG